MSIASITNEARQKHLEKWVAEYSDTVLRTCYVYLADKALAEDAMQDTFLKAWRNIDRFEGRNDSSIKTWIIRIAINTCIDYKKTAWHRRIDKSRIIDELPATEITVSDESRTVFLEVMQLPDKLKEVVLLYYFHDMKMVEISETLGINRVTVQRRLKKAYAQLRKQIEGGEFIET